MMQSSEFGIYRDLLGEIKTRVRQAQHRAMSSANAEMLLMYWDIGRMIAARQKEEGWGTGVIPRLAADLKNELPEQKGFSERNIGRMIAFYREYPLLPRPVAEIGAQTAPQLQNSQAQETVILPRPVAKLATSEIMFQLTWAHHITMMEKCKDLPTRLWYARQVIEQGWSRDTLLVQTKDRIFAEYALRDIHKPIGVAEYELTRSLPQELATSLPSIEDIEAEMTESLKG